MESWRTRRPACAPVPHSLIHKLDVAGPATGRVARHSRDGGAGDEAALGVVRPDVGDAAVPALDLLHHRGGRFALPRTGDVAVAEGVAHQTEAAGGPAGPTSAVPIRELSCASPAPVRVPAAVSAAIASYAGLVMSGAATGHERTHHAQGRLGGVGPGCRRLTAVGAPSLLPVDYRRLELLAGPTGGMPGRRGTAGRSLVEARTVEGASSASTPSWAPNSWCIPASTSTSGSRPPNSSAHSG